MIVSQDRAFVNELYNLEDTKQAGLLIDKFGELLSEKKFNSINILLAQIKPKYLNEYSILLTVLVCSYYKDKIPCFVSFNIRSKTELKTRKYTEEQLSWIYEQLSLLLSPVPKL